MDTITKEHQRISINNTPSIDQIRQKVSRLTSSQIQTEVRHYFKDGLYHRITVKLRYDDSCRNGHNTFSITANIDVKKKNNHWYEYSCGCLHNEITKYFPHLAPFIKWHLMSADKPLHYIANALYWLEKKDEEALRNTIIYGALESDYDKDFMNMSKENLRAHLSLRLPLLVKEFRKAMESLGFIY